MITEKEYKLVSYKNLKKDIWDLDEDAHSEAILQAIEEGDWTYDNVRRLADNANRRHRRASRRELPLLDDCIENSVSYEEDWIDNIQLDESCSQLDDFERDILDMRHTKRMNFVDIAAKLNISAMHTSRTYKKILKKLQEMHQKC